MSARDVFHLVGIGIIVPSTEPPTEYMETNLQGTVATKMWLTDLGTESRQ
jgi:hypothetical protein